MLDFSSSKFAAEQRLQEAFKITDLVFDNEDPEETALSLR